MKRGIKKFLFNWNVNHPYDRLFRKKYNLPFNSERHRESNQIDIMFEFYEDRMFEQIISKRAEKEKELEEYKKTGNFLTERLESDELISQRFDDLDLSQFNKQE